MDDALEERIEALERTVAEGEGDHELSECAEIEQRLSAVESHVETNDARIEELEAATQALRGYVGNIRAVNDEVEQRADAALAKVEALESTLEHAERTVADQPTATESAPAQTTSPAPSDEQQVTTPDTKRPGTECCQTCGRRRANKTETSQESRTATPPGATDGGSSIHRITRESETADDPLVPDDSDETGTLQRIRELL